MQFHTPHAAEMLFDRYGIPATEAIWRQALLAVTARPPASLLLKRQPDGREQHALWIEGVAVRVVYAPQSAMFVTALPPTNAPQHRYYR